MRLMVLFRRQSCPGGAYYVCQNGFTGCCSINPCDPGGTCADTTTTSAAASSETTSTPATDSPTTTSAAKSASTAVVSTTQPSASKSSTSTSASSGSASTSSQKSSTSSAASASTGLSCPGANGTTFTDSLRSRYEIRCGADNSFSSFDTANVTEGGFGQCFGPCDNATACAGFTFVGSDSGQCYLKTSVPDDGYSNTSGDNYVTCALTDRNSTKNAQQSSPSSNRCGKSNIGAIVGGVLGGVAVIVLCVFLLVFCIRRRRKKVEEITSATQNSYDGPKEAQTGDALFAPLGGFYRGQHSEAEKFQDTVANNPRSVVAESSMAKVRPQSSSGPSELDSNPVYSKALPAEIDGTSVPSLKSPTSTIEESPVLGRFDSGSFGPGRAYNLVENVRRRQHIMSWNNYDAREAVSPPASMSHGLSPRLGPPDVSPLP